MLSGAGRLGQVTPRLLSFPASGWTLALDFPARTPGLGPRLGQLDRLVLRHGGLVYLAKDSRPGPGARGDVARVPEFRKLRAELDSAGQLASDFTRRPSR